MGNQLFVYLWNTWLLYFVSTRHDLMPLVNPLRYSSQNSPRMIQEIRDHVNCRREKDRKSEIEGFKLLLLLLCCLPWVPITGKRFIDFSVTHRWLLFLFLFLLTGKRLSSSSRRGRWCWWRREIDRKRRPTEWELTLSFTAGIFGWTCGKYVGAWSINQQSC